MTSLERQMEQFRIAYASKNVTVGANDMVYKVSKGYSDKAAKSANILIERLGLDLTAIPTTLFAKDSFEIKSSEFEL